MTKEDIIRQMESEIASVTASIKRRYASQYGIDLDEIKIKELVNRKHRMPADDIECR